MPKRILLCAATQAEIQPILNQLQSDRDELTSNIERRDVIVDRLITGVGTAATVYSLTRQIIQAKPDLILHGGIAGAYDQTTSLGQVFVVASDQFADLGATDRDGSFMDVFDLGLLQHNDFPFREKILAPTLPPGLDLPYPKAHALTLNTVTGEANQIKTLRERYSAEVESMEGAALFYVAMMESIPVVALRSISNYVEPRNRAAWNIPLAVENLNEALIQIISNFTSEQ